MGGNNLSELVLNFDLADDLALDGIVATGGPSFDNPNFRHDAFNGSTFEAILRDVEGDVMLESQDLRDGFFQPLDPVVPMAPVGDLVVALIPTNLVEQSDGLRVVNFVSPTADFGPGLVGTSSDSPITNELPDRTFAPA